MGTPELEDEATLDVCEAAWGECMFDLSRITSM
jgi:hypothetical protein